ncbi:MAG: hypothetical protein JSR37_07830 [Verrucomicrobia bacterium]|nr:hypothetical protein [Verrucomicrobiota bacterium]
MANPVDKVFSEANLMRNIISFVPEEDRAVMRLVSRFCNVQVIRQKQNETIKFLDCLIAYLSKELESQEFALSAATRDQLTKPLTLRNNRQVLYAERGRLIDLTVAKVVEKGVHPSSLEAGYERRPLHHLFREFFRMVDAHTTIKPDNYTLDNQFSMFNDLYEKIRMAMTRNIEGFKGDDLEGLLCNRMVTLLEDTNEELDSETLEKLEHLGPGPLEYVKCFGNNVIANLQKGRYEKAGYFMNQLSAVYVKEKNDGFCVEDELPSFVNRLLATTVDHKKIQKVINSVDLLKMMGAGVKKWGEMG